MHTNKYIDSYQDRIIFSVKYCNFKGAINLRNETDLKIVQLNNSIFKCTREYDYKSKMYYYKTYLLDKDNKFSEMRSLYETSYY